MTKIIIKNSAAKRLKSGSLWVFSNEVIQHPDIDNGELIDVESQNGEKLGLAFYNRNSLISLRLLLTYQIPDVDFFVMRISKALEFRKQLMPERSMFRLVFGESDYLPGLVIDKYGDYFALQLLSAGMDKSIDMIINALFRLFPNTKGIIGKNQSALRSLEGLNSIDQVYFGVIPDEIICDENGIKLSINLSSGQKTGYFLDQAINRLFIRSISKDADVLDCFTNQAGFALNAYIGGARSIAAVDISQTALESAKTNAILNLANINFYKSDVFDFLNIAYDNGKAWDIIVVDPPSFTKSKKNVATAKKGYMKLNLAAIKAVREGGILLTCSCSQHIFENTFIEIVNHAAATAGRRLRMIYHGGQSPDHPILAGMPETNYLKCLAYIVD